MQNVIKLIATAATAFLGVGALIFSQSALAVSSGDKAPDFSLPSLTNGQAISLAQHKGKVVLVDFWASWCIPCRKSLPQFNALRHKIGADKFEILAINLDESKADATGFLKQYPVDYSVMWDSKGRTPEQYGIIGIPSSYIVDQNGVVRVAHKGFNEKSMAKYEAEIRNLLTK